MKITNRIKNIFKGEEEKSLVSRFIGLMEEGLIVHTDFLEDGDGLINHTILTVTDGKEAATSDPCELEWPLQFLPIPEALKEKIN